MEFTFPAGQYCPRSKDIRASPNPDAHSHEMEILMALKGFIAFLFVIHLYKIYSTLRSCFYGK